MEFDFVAHIDEHQRLKDENEQLREAMNRAAGKWAHADAENAKLRELVRGMWRFGFSKNAGADSAAEWNEMADGLHDRMRELGVGE